MWASWIIVMPQSHGAWIRLLRRRSRRSSPPATGHGQTSKPMSNGTCMHIKSRLIVAGRQEKVHARQIGRSDHLGSVSRLEPTDRRVIDSVGKRNLAQR